MDWSAWRYGLDMAMEFGWTPAGTERREHPVTGDLHTAIPAVEAGRAPEIDERHDPRVLRLLADRAVGGGFYINELPRLPLRIRRRGFPARRG